jgi:hypothetical protein
MVFDPLLSEASKAHSWRRPGDFDNFAEALRWANGNADCNPLAAPDCAQTAVNVALQLAALDVASDYLHAPPTVGSTGRLVVVGVGSLATTAARGPVPVEVDVALAAFLRDVTTTEVLGDAVVFVTSDGGAARSGMTVGQRAHTHVPLLWVLLPKVTVESNIELAQIVYDNGAAVVSGLDVYATLVYIAHGFDVRTIYPLHDAVGVGVWAWVCLRRVCMGGCASGGVGSAFFALHSRHSQNCHVQLMWKRSTGSRQLLFFPIESKEKGCDQPPFTPGVCPCGWRECPKGVRFGADSLAARSSPQPVDPITTAFAATVNAAIATSVEGEPAANKCARVTVDDFAVVRCFRSPVLFDARNMTAWFDVEVAHVQSHVFRATGWVSRGGVTFDTIAPLPRQGICRSGINEHVDNRRHWVIGCFCHTGTA